ncbi:MAG TPA: methyltransferase, partial [Chloroflexia bacterium]|nr:methyltransferase [Chloroflexia bacterium]
SSIEAALGLTAPLNTNIHRNDQMFSFIASSRGNGALAYSAYFTSGVQLLKTLEQIVRWKFGSFERVGSLLDFAGGYGRLTRFLVYAMPPDRVWVSDIQADAVAFQQAEFGVNGFVSTPDPADLPCDRTFDCIFVASLFSHLPSTTVHAWLKKLYHLLRPGGLLAFSVNDVSRFPVGLTMPETGIWFGEASEVASLDTKDYGTTFVTEAYVREAIFAATGRNEYRRVPYGVMYHKDLYVVVNEPAPDFSSLTFAYLPHGSVDYCLWTGQGDLKLRGWAVDFSADSAALRVQIFANDRLLRECTPCVHRPDVRDQYGDDRFLHAGWECSLPLANRDSAQPIVVKAVSAGGQQSLLYAGSIASLEPRGVVDLCYWTEPGLLHLGGWAVDTSGGGSPAEVQVLVDGVLRQKVLPFIRRPDLQQHFHDDRFLYASWECSLHLPDEGSSQIIVVRTISATGEESPVYTGSIAALERDVFANSSVQHAQLSSLQAELDRRLDYIQHLESELDERLGHIRHLEFELDRRLEYIRHLEAEVARKNAALADLEMRIRRWPWQRRRVSMERDHRYPSHPQSPHDEQR